MLYAAGLVLLINSVFGSDHRCTDYGGKCLDSRYYLCTGEQYWQTGICDGSTYRKCCVSNDYPCESRGGTCQTNTKSCSGDYLSGYCSGDYSNQCCMKGCELKKWTSSNIKGYYKDVWVQSEFESHMSKINTYASQSSVTVYVTMAFRKDGVPVDGAIVPPASHSNHLVGHAIDMNLDTPLGWCNSDCLLAAYQRSSYNSYAHDFIMKIMNDSSMRWGGVWSPTDPVHIDDGLNIYNDAHWEDLYMEIQP